MELEIEMKNQKICNTYISHPYTEMFVDDELNVYLECNGYLLKKIEEADKAFNLTFIDKGKEFVLKINYSDVTGTYTLQF